jgi:hypothetical protein
VDAKGTRETCISLQEHKAADASAERAEMQKHPPILSTSLSALRGVKQSRKDVDYCKSKTDLGDQKIGLGNIVPG